MQWPNISGQPHTISCYCNDLPLGITGVNEINVNDVVQIICLDSILFHYNLKCNKSYCIYIEYQRILQSTLITLLLIISQNKIDRKLCLYHVKNTITINYNRIDKPKFYLKCNVFCHIYLNMVSVKQLYTHTPSSAPLMVEIAS